MSIFKSVSDLCDVISILVNSVEDKTYLLQMCATTSEFFLPFGRCAPNTSWLTVESKLYKDLFGLELSSNQNQYTLRIYKVWIPLKHSIGSIYHCVYGIECDLESKKSLKASKTKNKVRWLKDFEVLQYCHHDQLKTPEVMDFIVLMQQRQQDTVNKQLTNVIGELGKDEYQITEPLVEVSENHMVISDQDKQRNNVYQLIMAANFKRNIQYLLFREFLFLCFPALLMNIQTFTKAFSDLGWSVAEIPFLFRAIDSNARHGILFRDFLTLLAAVDPSTVHSGVPAEIRARLMFRYYDRDNDGHLNYNEFKNCVLNVRVARKDSVDTLSVLHETDNSLIEIGIDPNKCLITINDFLSAVGHLRFRGTSLLFRLNTSVCQYILEAQGREKHLEYNSKGKAVKLNNSFTAHSQQQSLSMFNKSSAPFRNLETAPSDRSLLTTKPFEYQLATHVIKFQAENLDIIDYDNLFNFESAISEMNIVESSIEPLRRTYSLDTFSDQSLTNEILQSLRYLTNINSLGNIQLVFNVDMGYSRTYLWSLLDWYAFGKSLIRVANEVRNIFIAEPRLLAISSPVYIMGDLHGNFCDLLSFKKLLWHYGTSLNSGKLLFLGDYVDRGFYGMEVIAYLFSCKIQSPKKVFMVRGNHEIRYVQTMFTFANELNVKFGERLGTEIWNAINYAFDSMPVAAIIDTKIFCCHGGIPPPWLCPAVSAINSVPSVLTDPETQSPLAWELMWNDPVNNSALTETALLELNANEGFGVNKRRGTGHIFSADALERFLQVNHFTHIVRAHELVPNGFKVQQHGKLITIFSSSHYCGATNDAACVVVDDNKLRIFRIV